MPPEISLADGNVSLSEITYGILLAVSITTCIIIQGNHDVTYCARYETHFNKLMSATDTIGNDSKLKTAALTKFEFVDPNTSKF